MGLSSGEENHSSSLFTRLARRKSQTLLKTAFPGLEVCKIKNDCKFVTPKIVRASTIHIQGGKDLKNIEKRRDLSAPKNILTKQSEVGPRKRSDEMNRIFNANKIKRKIGFDLLLDNYKAKIQKQKEIENNENPNNSKENEKPKKWSKKLQKVFAAGKFIGYLKTGITEIKQES